MATTSIEWTRGDDGTPGVTWNPTSGCDKVSPGCDNCYALTLSKRLKAMGSPKYQNDGDPATSGPGFGLTIHPDTLDAPLSWRKPRRVFVNSIVGGESGRGFRPIDPQWVRSLRDQCRDGPAFFFKQWGGIRPKSGGRELDGRTWDEMPGGAP